MSPRERITCPLILSRGLPLLISQCNSRTKLPALVSMDGFAVLAMVTFLAVVTFAVENGYGKVGILCSASTIAVHL